MGNTLQGYASSIGGNIANKMAENQKLNMERQQKVMIAMGMARARDNVYWIAGVWSLVATAAVLVKLKKGAVPTPMLAPLAVLPIAGAYQADMAWGTKMQRVRREYHHIVEKEQWWFNVATIDAQLLEEATHSKK